jgi:hypothetical protein
MSCVVALALSSVLVVLQKLPEYIKGAIKALISSSTSFSRFSVLVCKLVCKRVFWVFITSVSTTG